MKTYEDMTLEELEDNEDEFNEEDERASGVLVWGARVDGAMLELPQQSPLFYDLFYQDLTLTPSSVRLL